MIKFKTKGECIGCKKSFTSGQGGRHLASCSKLQEVLNQQASQVPGYLLKVTCRYQPSIYWMYITIPADAKLSFLDQFLRDTWLECCGHLSKFDIEYETYASAPFGGGERSMKKKIDTIFYPGLVLDYEYDFGDTSELKLEVIDRVEACPPKAINILMKNAEPTYHCTHCNNQAQTICAFCFDTLCLECVPEHPCVKKEEDTYMIRPLVNSPRVGMCGYEG